VIPAADGSTNLSLTTSTGDTDAQLFITNTTGNNSQVWIQNTAGGNSQIFLGEINTEVLITAPSGPGQVGTLQISSATDPITNYVVVDTIGNNVILGAPPIASPGVPAGTVQVNSALLIRDQIAAPNGLGISPISPTASQITQSVANSGTVSIGSSVANGTILNVRDGAAAGSGFVDITSGTSATSTGIRLDAVGRFGTPVVSTNLLTGAAGSLTLTVGSDDATPAMVISNDGGGNVNIDIAQQMNIAKTPFGQGSYVAQTLLPSGTAYSGNTTVDLTGLPTGWAMIYGYSPTPDAADRNAMFSVMVYTSATNLLIGGGLGGLSGFCSCQPSPSNPAALQVNFGSATSTNYEVRGITLLGG